MRSARTRTTHLSRTGAAAGAGAAGALAGRAGAGAGGAGAQPRRARPAAGQHSIFMRYLERSCSWQRQLARQARCKPLPTLSEVPMALPLHTLLIMFGALRPCLCTIFLFVLESCLYTSRNASTGLFLPTPCYPRAGGMCRYIISLISLQAWQPDLAGGAGVGRGCFCCNLNPDQ